MITRFFEEFICFVTQHDHARISLDIFNCFNENLKQKTNNLDALKYSIRNHDSGWIEFDNYPKVSNDNKVYSFQDLNQELQNELWFKSINSSINPYSSLLIYEHFKYLSLNSSRENSFNDDFINKSESLIKKLLPYDLDEIRETDEFKFELSCLQICDLISLVICREKELGGKKPSLFLDNSNIIDYKLKKIDKSVYKVSSELFSKKENLFEIPYKQIELDLVMEPKKLKKKYIESELKFRKIYFIT
ncbi:DUF3891 family protein [bacterium]|nr:DUF3891 family protein [bacterium]